MMSPRKGLLLLLPITNAFVSPKVTTDVAYNGVIGLEVAPKRFKIIGNIGKRSPMIALKSSVFAPEAEAPSAANGADTTPQLLAAIWKALNYAIHKMDKGEQIVLEFPNIDFSEPGYLNCVINHFNSCKDVCYNFGKYHIYIYLSSIGLEFKLSF